MNAAPTWSGSGVICEPRYPRRRPDRALVGAVAAALPYGFGHLRHLGVRGREDGEVEHAVLLGADELLAVEQQHGAHRVVDEEQLRHAAALRHLGDPGEAARERLAEREVAGLGRAGPQQREHRELARRLGAREGEGGGVEEALEHGRLRGWFMGSAANPRRALVAPAFLDERGGLKAGALRGEGVRYPKQPPVPTP
jgi:hypothetical protein